MKRIGVDESGKGDYFGYLVIAGVVVDDSCEKKLRALGVKDSKKLSDMKVQELARAIKKSCIFDIVKFSPEKYNMRYKQFKNLNKMLAWGHARTIEDLLEKTDVDTIIVDKFADESVLKGTISANPNFTKAGKKNIIQNVRAESDVAVAAASVIARAEFLRTLRSLSREIGIQLPKGAAHLDGAIKEIREKYSDDVFHSIAKLHFKTSKKIGGGK